MKAADRSGARFALVLGERDLAAGRDRAQGPGHGGAGGGGAGRRRGRGGRRPAIVGASQGEAGLMTARSITVGGTGYRFADLRELMAKATPAALGRRAGRGARRSRRRSGWPRSWCSPTCRCAPSSTSVVVAYEDDEVTRLILDTHDAAAFAPVASMTVGEFRDWLLLVARPTRRRCRRWRRASRPRWRRRSASSCECRTWSRWPASAGSSPAFRSTLGLPGRLATRLQPNHPTDDPVGIAASLADGCCWARRRRHRHQPGDRPAARPCAGCSSCSTTSGSATRSRPSRACSPT